jgi:hypothetical protein
VIKRTENKRVVEVTRKMSLGTLEHASNLLQASRGGTVLNTAFIERLNGTMRERLATLTRKCRHAAHRVHPLETGMYLIGTTYNFCCPHQELSKRSTPGQQKQTPAMASGITDHLWGVLELLRYKVAPPPWVKPKRRGRPRKRPLPDPDLPKRPQGRPRKIR